jgi:hypothetical protein
VKSHFSGVVGAIIKLLFMENSAHVEGEAWKFQATQSLSIFASFAIDFRVQLGYDR